MSISLLYALFVALLTGRRFYCISLGWWFRVVITSDEFWNNTNSCLRPLKWEGNTDKLRICKGNLLCFKQKQNPTSLKRQNVLFQDVRFYHNELETTWELRMLRNIGIASPADSWMSLKRKILRVVLNPSDELTQVILQERKRIGPAEHQVGVHVRCAGKLSDYKESVRMVTVEQIPQFRFFAKQMLKSIASKQRYVFLTTDSTYAENHFKKGMGDAKAITFSGYKRGHTSDKRVTDLSFKRSLVDLYLLVQSKMLVLTSKSGYSRIARIMSKAGKVRNMRVSYHCVCLFLWKLISI